LAYFQGISVMNQISRAALGAILLLAATAAVAAKPRSDKAIAPGEGAVLMTVAVDYPSAIVINAAAPQLIPNLSVEKVDDPAHPRYQLEPRLEGLSSARAYAGSLPPGRYRVRDLMGDTCKLMCGPGKWYENDLAEFDVVAGEVTWLGSIMTRFEPKLPGKDYKIAWAYEDEPSLALGQRLLDGLYPELAAAKPTLARHWLPFAKGTQAAAEARAHMHSEPSGQNEFSFWGEDGFCFGAQHGIAKCWSRSSGYQALDTGNPYVLRSVVRHADGRILAGGEASTLLYSGDDGAHWSDAGASLPWGVVAQVEDIGNDEVMFTLVAGKSVHLYRGSIATREWKQVGEYPLAFAFWTGLPGAYPALLVQGRAAVLTLPSKNAMYIDLDGEDTHPATPPGSIGNMTFTADGVLRCSCARSIAVNPWESADQGRTWRDSPLDRWMVLPVFRNAQEGFSFKGAWLNAKNVAVMATSDGGKTWSSPGPPPALGWWTPAYTHDGSVMVLAGMAMHYKKYAVEEFNVSTDGGKSWQRASRLPAWLPEAAEANGGASEAH
jgi:photosystem II stability/assembly factor-like uncharacterized protein